MPTSKVPPSTSTPEHWGAPSSAYPRDFPVRVHAGGEPRVGDGDGELDSQPDGLNHGLNLLESSKHLS